MSYQYVLELFRPSLKLLENKIKKEDQLASTRPVGFAAGKNKDKPSGPKSCGSPDFALSPFYRAQSFRVDYGGPQ